MTIRTLTISAPTCQPDASRLLEQILDGLRRAGVSCAPVGAGSEPLAKSSGGSLVSVIVGGVVSAAGLRAIAQVLVAIVRRSGERRVEVRLGDDVVIIDGASARDGRTALDGFLDRVGAVKNDAVVTVDEA